MKINKEKIEQCKKLIESNRLSPKDVEEVRGKIQLLKLGVDVEIGIYRVFSK